MATKKKNPQDATRAKDVTPLRRRIKTLENEMKSALHHIEVLETAVQKFGIKLPRAK